MLQYPTRSRYCWTRQIHQKKHRRAWTLERTRPSGRAEHLPTEATSLPPSSVNWLIWPAVLLEEQVEPREAPHKPASVRRIKSKGTAKSSRQSRPKRAATKKKYRPITRSGNRSKRISAEKNDSLTATEDDSKRSFPVRLFDMLADVEERGLSDIVSWQQHGRAIRVHKPHRFVTDILPHYFRQSKITSFQRQLNVYGFRRIIYGKDAGSYHHSLFLRGVRDLAFKMDRQGTKNMGVRSTYLFAEEEPDFDAMPPITEALIKTLSEQTLDVVKAIQFVNKPIVERLLDMTLDASVRTEAAASVTPHIPDSSQKAQLMSPAEVCSSCVTPDLDYYDEQQRQEEEEDDGEEEENNTDYCYATDGDLVDFEGKSFYYMDSMTLNDIAAAV
mmetsp:Transcript_9978/g.21572  ORF Transcript_9978/g.21572 Transcript_9978/m.21572 type:complete len:387 (+) Transcript_9978:109-1269(+)